MGLLRGRMKDFDSQAFIGILNGLLITFCAVALAAIIWSI